MKSYEITVKDDDRNAEYFLEVEAHIDGETLIEINQVTLGGGMLWFGKIGVAFPSFAESSSDLKAIGDGLFERFSEEIHDEVRRQIVRDAEADRYDEAELAELLRYEREELNR